MDGLILKVVVGLPALRAPMVPFPLPFRFYLLMVVIKTELMDMPVPSDDHSTKTEPKSFIDAYCSTVKNAQQVLLNAAMKIQPALDIHTLHYSTRLLYIRALT